MNVAHLLPHVPSIEAKIREHRLDALVLGLGPSGWLVPWLDSTILQNLRLWGSHDIHRIIPVDDLVLMDSPSSTGRLLPGTAALEACLASRPKRIWINDWWTDEWDRHLHFSVKSIVQPVKFWVWTSQQRSAVPGQPNPKQWCFGWPTPHCGLISPLACATMAWREGARRIGVIGVDCGPEHRQTHQHRKALSNIFCHLANDAHERGGCLVNLSPITYLSKFAEWTPSVFSSAQTDTSSSTEPKPSSNTASASTAAGPT